MGQIMGKFLKIGRQLNETTGFQGLGQLITSQFCQGQMATLTMLSPQDLQGLTDFLTLLIKDQNFARPTGKISLLG